MDFAAAEAYLLATINETVSRRMPYRLERMRAFMHELGDPQDAYPTIHIGGTSGKGSTSTMIAAALQASGRRVGLHTKPHLRSMTERARIDGAAIEEARFARLLDDMMPAIERVAAEHGRPTYYETLLALAFMHFAHERVDAAVIEVGLGGRLDGTNVITPQVAAITSIGYDHMDVLGDTLEEIALEKAGIAKPGVPLVIAVDDEGARAVVEREAAAVGAPLVHAREAVRVAEVRTLRDAQRFTLESARGRYEIATALLGEFQRANASTAVAVLERLPAELRPAIADVERAFAELTIPGRMEIYPGDPTAVFDIAHNAEKAAHLAASLRESFPNRHVTFVVAIGESKDAREILRAFASVPASFVFTAFDAAGRHATPPERLASLAAEIGVHGPAFADSFEALAAARRGAGAGEVIVVSGSTFIVAELRTRWPVAV